MKAEHQDRVLRNEAQVQRLARARQAQLDALLTLGADNDPKAIMEVAVIENEQDEAAYQATVDISYKLIDLEDTQHKN